MRKFNPGITDVLYYTTRVSTTSSLAALDISDIDAPVFVGMISYGENFSSDLRADFTGNSYGPLSGGLYTFTAVVYQSGKPASAGQESMVCYDVSNIGGGELTQAVNGRYEDATALFDIAYFDVDVARQYLFGTVSDASNDYIFAMDTWGTATAGGSSTEGMIASDILDTLNLPLSVESGRPAYDCSYDSAAAVLYVVAKPDTGLPTGDVIAVNCTTASALSITGTYGDTYTNATARSCRVLPANDNSYSSTSWLYVGTDADYLLKLNCSTPSAMTQQSVVNVGAPVQHIFVPDEAFNYIYVCGGATVASIGNAKSSGSVTLASSLTIAGAVSITAISATTLSAYGTRYVFATDFSQDKIYVISVSGSGALALYATWDYLSIPSSTAVTSTARLSRPTRSIYQSLV